MLLCERAGGSCASPDAARGFVCVCLCARRRYLAWPVGAEEAASGR